MLSSRCRSYKKRTFTQISSVRYTRATEFCHSYYLSVDEKHLLEKALMEFVPLFYFDIVNLVCDYLKPQLTVPLSLDVCDERGMWMEATIVSKVNNHVAVHYNGCNCDYDDWIHVGSLRLAPLHTHTIVDYTEVFSAFAATDQQIVQTEQVVQQLLYRASVFRWSSMECAKRSLELIQRNNQSMEVTQIVLEIERLYANRYQFALNHTKLFKYTSCPHLFRLEIYNKRYKKALLEEKAKKSENSILQNNV